MGFNEASRRVEADWEDNGINYTLSGKWEPKKKSQDFDITFTLVCGNDRPIFFSGTIDALRTHIKGKCSAPGSQELKYGFRFDIAELVPGLIQLKIGTEQPEHKIIVMDY